MTFTCTVKQRAKKTTYLSTCILPIYAYNHSHSYRDMNKNGDAIDYFTLEVLEISLYVQGVSANAPMKPEG